MDRKNLDKPACEIVLPEAALRPVIFSSPHSGRDYPARFLAISRLNEHEIRQSEDCFVDQLFVEMPKFGAVLLKANFPRAFVDVNREPYELDPEMFEDSLPDHVNTTSIRVAGGLGTIARVVGTNLPIYDGKLQYDEAVQRIDKCYFPYHQAIRQLIEQKMAEFGEVLLIDCHSMPSKASAGRYSMLKRPDIILGDRFGGSCRADLCQSLEEAFVAQGFKVSCNKPYAGGFITRNYGRPLNNVNVIQVEINRSLYMDEKHLVRTSGFEEFKLRLEKVFADFLATSSLAPATGSLAAE